MGLSRRRSLVASCLRKFISSEENQHEFPAETVECPEHSVQVVRAIRVERSEGLLTCSVSEDAILRVQGSSAALLAAAEAFDFSPEVPINSEHRLSGKHDPARVSPESIPLYILTCPEK